MSGHKPLETTPIPVSAIELQARVARLENLMGRMLAMFNSMPLGGPYHLEVERFAAEIGPEIEHVVRRSRRA